MRLPRSLPARITLAAVAALALSLLLAGWALLAAVGRDGRGAVDDQLRTRAARVVEGSAAADPYGGQRARSSDLLAGADTFARLIDDSGELQAIGDVPSRRVALPKGTGLSTVRVGSQEWRSLTVRYVPGVRLELLQSLAPVEDRVDSTRGLVVLFGLLALALTAIASWRLSSLVLRPLARLRAATAGVAGTGDLSTRVPDDTAAPDEVRSLSGELNAMLERLQQSAQQTDRALAATRRFAADAGHELRTPMTSIQANLDTLIANPQLPAAEREQTLREIASDQQRMTALLGGLQALTRGDAAQAIPREAVDLGDVADAALQAARRRHPAVHFELVEEAPSTVLQGWPDGLRILVDNLVENAALHGRPEGRVEVRVVEAGEERLRLEVDDDGPGVPPAERQRVLERFARGRIVRGPGSGLGLAVADQQAELHGGSLRLADGPLGGLAVIVELARR